MSRATDGRTHRSTWPGPSHHTHHRWAAADLKVATDLGPEGGGSIIITDANGSWFGGQVVLGFRDDAALLEFCRKVEGLHRELLGVLYPDEADPEVGGRRHRADPERERDREALSAASPWERGEF